MTTFLLDKNNTQYTLHVFMNQILNHKFTLTPTQILYMKPT